MSCTLHGFTYERYMAVSLTRILVTTVLILAFLGQGFAAVSMSCEMSLSEQSSHDMVMQENMQHVVMSSHSMADMNQADDCCDIDCKCPEQACHSITLLNSQSVVFYTESSSEKIPSADVNQRQFTSQSLYRPPITA